MIRLRITVDGVGEVIALVDRAEHALSPPIITRAVLGAAVVYRGGARRRAPGPRTGALEASIGARPIGPATAVTETDLHYAWVHELGAVIRPVRAQALRFEVAGQVVFARKVVIPARPYFVPTFDQDTDKAFDEFVDRVGQHIGF